ncbi:hypothetical protein BASA81_002660 [Batrachochytrium salamandrivorans]|nr:hypothetical protein BASA81_002660 [Batrachochytrium salamandrivorans]
MASYGEFEVKEFNAFASRCNTILGSVHEGCGPYLTPKERAKFGLDSDYGGITGTIVPRDIGRVAELLMTGKLESYVLPVEFLFEPGESVFLDVGCGTGRPTCYFAKLGLKCSLGLDIDALQVVNSTMGYTKLQSHGMAWQCPISFFKQDCLELRSFGPTTHAYAFVGYSELAAGIARLVLNSPALKALVLVVLKRDELKACGLLDKEDENDKKSETIVLGGMKMGGGYSYLGLVIPITPHRRSVIAKALKQQNVTRLKSDKLATNPIQLELLMALKRGVNGEMTSQVESRPVRACSSKTPVRLPTVKPIAVRQKPALKLVQRFDDKIEPPKPAVATWCKGLEMESVCL